MTPASIFYCNVIVHEHLMQRHTHCTLQCILLLYNVSTKLCHRKYTSRLKTAYEGSLPEIVQYGPSSRFECLLLPKNLTIIFIYCNTVCFVAMRHGIALCSDSDCSRFYFFYCVELYILQTYAKSSVCNKYGSIPNANRGIASFNNFVMSCCCKIQNVQTLLLIVCYNAVS